MEILLMDDIEIGNIDVTDSCFNDMLTALAERAELLKELSTDMKNPTLLSESMGILKSIDIIKVVKKKHDEKNLLK